MKNIYLLIIPLLLATTSINAMSYTFTGNGLYTDASLWTPSFPGLVLDNADDVTITEGSYCEIPQGNLVNAFGTMVNNGAMVFYNSSAFGHNGIWINNGVMEIHATFYSLGGFTNNNIITSYSTFAIISNGTFDNSNGVMINNAVFMDEQLDIQSGVFKGTGSTAFDFKNSGLLAPGLSPGVFSFGFNFEQSETGVTEIELAGIGGAGESNGHDKLMVGQVATLDGTLKVLLLDGYNPPVGTEFIIMEYASHTENLVCSICLEDKEVGL